MLFMENWEGFLYRSIAEKTAKFWLKILSNTDSLIYKIFQDQVYETENRLITNRNTAKMHWTSLWKSYIEK